MNPWAIPFLLVLLAMLTAPLWAHWIESRPRASRPYDWRSERECEELWDEVPPRHVKVLR